MLFSYFLIGDVVFARDAEDSTKASHFRRELRHVCFVLFCLSVPKFPLPETPRSWIHRYHDIYASICIALLIIMLSLMS